MLQWQEWMHSSSTFFCVNLLTIMSVAFQITIAPSCAGRWENWCGRIKAGRLWLGWGTEGCSVWPVYFLGEEWEYQRRIRAMREPRGAEVIAKRTSELRWERAKRLRFQESCYIICANACLSVSLSSCHPYLCQDTLSSGTWGLGLNFDR